MSAETLGAGLAAVGLEHRVRVEHGKQGVEVPGPGGGEEGVGGLTLDMHIRELRKAGESEERIGNVAAWRDAPWYTDPERAALALTEAATRIADRPEAITDEILAEAAEHYDDAQLGGLLLDIGTINVWNRLNAAVRTVAGSWSG